MKHFILIIFIFFSLFTVKAQFIKGALTGGFNLSQVDGDQVFGFRKFGLNLGPSAIIPVKNNFSIVLEVLYSEKGSSQRPVDKYVDSTQEYRLKLNYAEVPLLIQYADKGGFVFGAGMSYGRLVSVKEKQFDHTTQTIKWDNISLNDGTYNKNDYEVLADIRCRIYDGVYLNLRYAYSLAKIRTRNFGAPWKKTRYQYNNLISFRVVWVINEKHIEQIKQKNKEENND